MDKFNKEIDLFLENFDSEGIREVLNRALGHDWELELEPYRGVDLQEISHLRAI